MIPHETHDVYNMVECKKKKAIHRVSIYSVNSINCYRNTKTERWFIAISLHVIRNNVH